MTAETDLLPLPWIERYSVVGDIAYPVSSDPDGDYVAHDDHTAAMQAYARANVAHATAAKDAEIEALRAEVVRLRRDRDDCLAAREHYASLYGEQHGRAERLAVALDELADEWEDNGWPDPASALRSAVAALDPTAAQEGNDHG